MVNVQWFEPSFAPGSTVPKIGPAARVIKPEITRIKGPGAHIVKTIYAPYGTAADFSTGIMYGKPEKKDDGHKQLKREWVQPGMVINPTLPPPSDLNTIYSSIQKTSYKRYTIIPPGLTGKEYSRFQKIRANEMAKGVASNKSAGSWGVDSSKKTPVEKPSEKIRSINFEKMKQIKEEGEQRLTDFVATKIMNRQENEANSKDSWRV